MKKILFLITIFSISLITNAQNNKRIRGNGNVITVKRTTAEYDKIMVGGSFDVVLVKGKEGDITIEGEENIIPYLETEIDGDVLKIGYKRNININTNRKLTVTVSIRKIEAISLGGSGKITAKDPIKTSELSVNLGGSGDIDIAIDAKEVRGKIGGSGDIKLTGVATSFSSSIAGSGSIKAYDLTVNTANITIAGSGSVRLTVNDEIQSKIVGSGSVFYKGNPPRINTRAMGSGKVVDKN